MLSLLVLICSALAAPKPLPALRLAVDNGGVLERETVTLALVGNTRPTTPALDRGRAIGGGAQAMVIGDMTAQNMLEPLDMLVLLGDMVASSTTGAWRGFGDQFAALVDGSTVPPTALRRVPIVPVVGDRDCAKESSCESIAKVFPGFGQDIGFGRVATWQSFDIVVGERRRWRVVSIDTNKKGLGSRWREQVVWLKDAVSSPGQGLIVLMHQGPVTRDKAGPDAGAVEVMEIIGEHAPLMSLKAVFSAGEVRSQVFLPEGPLGPLFVNAGGGGAPTRTISRGLKGSTDPVKLEEGFEKALDGLVASYGNASTPPPQNALDEAVGSGTFEGFSREMDGNLFPTHGWWRLRLTEAGMDLTWRARQVSGELADQGRWVWSADGGWSSN